MVPCIYLYIAFQLTIWLLCIIIQYHIKYLIKLYIWTLAFLLFYFTLYHYYYFHITELNNIQSNINIHNIIIIHISHPPNHPSKAQHKRVQLSFKYIAFGSWYECLYVYRKSNVLSSLLVCHIILILLSWYIVDCMI